MSALVLCVENSKPMLDSMIRSIARLGVHPVPAANEEEAIRILETECIAKVITDMSMLDVRGGLRVLLAAKGKTPPIPTLVYTGDPVAEPLLDEARRLGADMVHKKGEADTNLADAFSTFVTGRHGRLKFSGVVSAFDICDRIVVLCCLSLVAFGVFLLFLLPWIEAWHWWALAAVFAILGGGAVSFEVYLGAWVELRGGAGIPKGE